MQHWSMDAWLLEISFSVTSPRMTALKGVETGLQNINVRVDQREQVCIKNLEAYYLFYLL